MTFETALYQWAVVKKEAEKFTGHINSQTDLSALIMSLLTECWNKVITYNKPIINAFLKLENDLLSCTKCLLSSAPPIHSICHKRSSLYFKELTNLYHLGLDANKTITNLSME